MIGFPPSTFQLPLPLPPSTAQFSSSICHPAPTTLLPLIPQLLPSFPLPTSHIIPFLPPSVLKFPPLLSPFTSRSSTIRFPISPLSHQHSLHHQAHIYHQPQSTTLDPSFTIRRPPSVEAPIARQCSPSTIRLPSFRRSPSTIRLLTSTNRFPPSPQRPPHNSYKQLHSAPSAIYCRPPCFHRINNQLPGLHAPRHLARFSPSRIGSWERRCHLVHVRTAASPLLRFLLLMTPKCRPGPTGVRCGLADFRAR
jgi:hypothetical protein